MLDKHGTYPIACLMGLVQASRVREMIRSHAEFSRIEMTINWNGKTDNPLQDKKVPEGEVLVIFCVPREGVKMVDFFREFSETLNQESPATVQRERAT